MISQTALAGFTVPIRWTFSTNSKSAISILEKVLSRSTPALATRMSMRPQASMACLTIKATPASSVTDEPLAIASPPKALISSTTAWAASEPPPEPSTEPPRSLTTTRAPRRASSRACWRPRPPPGPVDGAPQVIDHDARAAAGELKGVLTAEAPAGAGDDGHFAVEADVRHG